jgi:putative phosphoribosyl transferase
LKPVFYDRSDAGLKLAEMLEAHRGSDALVLAIPTDGVPVAAEMARTLALQFDAAVRNWGLTREQVEGGIAEARGKVERRLVLLVDDGIAAGSTMRTAIAALRRQAAGRTWHVFLPACR